MTKFGRGMTAQDLVDHIDLQLEVARDDAHSHGAGWLMVDQQGRIERVSPAEVAAWGVRKDKSR